MSLNKSFIKINKDIFKNRNIDKISFYYYIVMLYYDEFTGKSKWSEGSITNGINSIIKSNINSKLIKKPLTTLVNEKLLDIEYIERDDYNFNFYMINNQILNSESTYLKFNIITIHYLLSRLNPDEFYTFMMIYQLLECKEELPYTLSELNKFHKDMNKLFLKYDLNYDNCIFNKLLDKEIINVRFYPPKEEGWGPTRRLFFDINN